MGRWSKAKKNRESQQLDPSALKQGDEGTVVAGQPQEAPSLYDGPKAAEGSLEKTQQRQKEVEEVTDIMNKNVDNMLVRGENLQDLSQQTETLQTSSKQFSKNAEAVKKKLWWKNVKMGIIVAAILLVIIIAVIVWSVMSNKKDKKNAE